MGLFDLSGANQKSAALVSNPISDQLHPVPEKVTLSEHEKAELTVQRVSLQDMAQISALPYAWNSDIKKVIGPSTQPFAYMDIIESNVDVACEALGKVNAALHDAYALSSYLPCDLQIPIKDIQFTPRENKSYSKIICTPHTFTGRIAKYPAHLTFMTDFPVDGDSTHGELYYGRSGNVEKANIYFWRSHNGYFFYLSMLKGEFTVCKIESTVAADDNQVAAIIYKVP